MTTPFRADPVAPPPPPPLPPARYGQRAVSALARIAQPLFYPSRPPSAQGARLDAQGSINFQSAAKNGPALSKSGAHSVHTSIESLDISPQRTHAVLAGRNVLKTIRVDGDSCVEDLDIRANIVARAAAKNASVDAIAAQYREQLSAVDVKWSNGRYEHTIATAANSGRIVTYDIQRAGVETGKCHEHERQVHRLAFNPHEGSSLLSGSQDGTTRLWDLRQWTGRSASVFDGKNEGVRDVRWSIADGFEFAVSTSNGVIQRWDVRKAKIPIIKINAHDSTCFAIDWHPAGKYLASAGADKNVKIWDCSSSDRRMKPTTVLRAPQAIRKVRWRYPSGSVTRSDAASRCTQVATVYTDKDPRIHTWDLTRPHSIDQEIDRYKTPASDILWHSADILWSVGEAGVFTQTDMHFASKPHEKSNAHILDTSSDGEICLFTQIKPRKLASDGSINFLHRAKTGDSSGERLSGGQRSKENGSFEETETLHPPMRLHREGSASVRSTGGTPPSKALGDRLEEVLKTPNQSIAKKVSAYGHVPGNVDREGFAYLARKYQNPMDSKAFRGNSAIHQDMRQIFEHNAERAFCAGEYRTGQTWKFLGEALEVELEARANAALQCRNKEGPKHPSISSKDREIIKISSPSSKLSQPRKSRPVSSVLSNLDNSSQATTPLVRPTNELPRVPSSVIFSPSPKATFATPVILSPSPKPEETITMPELRKMPEYDGYSYSSSPQISPKASREVNDQPPTPEESPLPDPTISVETSLIMQPSAEEDTEQRRVKIENFRAAPRPILHLDSGLGLQPAVAPYLLRHDSNDSFNINLFSTSADSSQKALSLGDSFGESQSSASPVATRKWNPKLSRGFSIDRDASDGEGLGFDAAEAEQDVLKDKLEDLDPSQVAISASCPGQEASDAHVIRQSPSLGRHANVPKPIIHHLPLSPPPSPLLQILASPRPSASSTYLLEDFLPTSVIDDSSLAPWTFSALLPKILDYYLDSLIAPQVPSFLILYLAPLFPTLLPPPEKILSILHSYHALLTSLDLYVPAAQLRKTCHDLFPDWEVFSTPKDQALASRSFVPWCPTCNAPLLLPESSLGNHFSPPNDFICQRCHLHSPLCPICNTASQPLAPPNPPARDSYNEPHPVPLGPDKMWRLCPTCQHGAHASCLTAWWDGGEDHGSGVCPWSGCGCACVIGYARAKFDEKRKGDRKGSSGRSGTGVRRGSNLGRGDVGRRKSGGAELQDEDEVSKEGQTSLVRSDGWVVQDTPAVEGARGVLKGSEGRGGPSAGRRSGGRRVRGARGNRGQERKKSGRGAE